MVPFGAQRVIDLPQPEETFEPITCQVPVEWADMARRQMHTMENKMRRTAAGHPLPMRRPNEPPLTQGPPPEASGLVGRERQSKRAEDTLAASSRSSQRAITSSRSQRPAGPSVEETRDSEENEESEEDDGESVDASSSLAVVPDPSCSGSLYGEDGDDDDDDDDEPPARKKPRA